MPSLPRVAVLVPAWNEASTVGDVVRDVLRELPEATVVVIDDGSADATRAEALAAGAQVLPLPYNLGVGGAMRAGYRYAARHGFDAAVQVDADGQHDPAEIRTLLDALDDADIAIGARFAGRGEYDVRGPRRWAMVLLAAAMSRITGVRLTDVTSGFRATNRRAIARFALDYPVEYLGDTIESLMLASRAGLRITQVPVAMRPRLGGQPSQNPVKAAVYLARAVFVLLLGSIRRDRPGSFNLPAVMVESAVPTPRDADTRTVEEAS